MFGASGIKLTVTFTTPLLIDDVEVMARPVTYITFSVRIPSFRSDLFFDVELMNELKLFSLLPIR